MRKTKTLQEVLHHWMKNSGKEQLFYEMKIKEEWARLLGERIQSKTLSLSWAYQDRIVLVNISDPLLKNELNYAKFSILEKLNAAIPDIQIDKILIV